MLVCNVSLRPRRTAIAADVAEITSAVDATATGSIVFATLVDDPASVGDFVDAYSGEIMLEVANATAVQDGAVPAVYTLAVDETGSFSDTLDASIGIIVLATFNGTPSAGLTVSNGGRTVTYTANNNVGVTSTSFVGSGKYYFEVVATQVQNGASNGIGIILSTGLFSQFNGGTVGTEVLLNANTPVYSNGATTGKLLGNNIFGDTYSFAIDLTARLGWVRKNGGNWNATAGADPATGTGGVTIAAGLFAPCATFNNSCVPGDNMTANFGQVAYSYAMPSGFSNWPG